MWEREYGGKDDWLSTLPPDVPARDGEPELWPENEEAHAAFYACSPRRPIGFGFAAIPLSEIAAYCAMHRVDDREELARKVTAVDAEYVRIVREELERKRQK